MRKILKGERILGIDPGSRVAGFSVLEAKSLQNLAPKDFKLVEIGVITLKKERSLPERLGDLHDSLFEIIGRVKPDYFAIEKAFVGQNASSALKLGEARGALTSAARRFKLVVEEITPAEVKKVITGSGVADKEEIRKALGDLMGFNTIDLPYDASDALGVALSFALLGGRRPAARRGGARMVDVAKKVLGESAGR